MERVFIIIKPDGIQRRLVGEVISRLERKGLYLVQSKVCIPTRDILKQHYAEHEGKPFFEGMVASMSKSQVMPMIWEGENAVVVARKLVGATKPSEALHGTIRGDYGLTMGKNIIHCADSTKSAEREISIWFGENIPSIVHFDKDFIYE